NTLRSTHSTYPSVHAVGLAEPCAKTNRRRPPQPALCPKAPAALKPAAKIAKTHPPQTQICHGISAREKCRLNRFDETARVCRLRPWKHNCMEAYKQNPMTTSHEHQTSQFFRAWRAQFASRQLPGAGRRSLCTLASIVAIVCLCLGFSATSLHAQGYGTISGTVSDSTGAVISSATVTATQTLTGTETTTVTG